MGIDAIGIGPYDLSAGVDFFKTVPFEKAPLLSINLYDTATDQPVFKPFTIVRKNDIKIGVTGVTKPFAVTNNLYFKDYEELLSELLTNELKNTDLTVVLSSLSEAQNRALAKKFPMIQLILSSDKNSRDFPPKLVGNTLFSQGVSRGKYFEMLQINVGTENKWANDYKQEINTHKKRIEALTWQSNRQNALLKKNPGDKNILNKIEKLSKLLQTNRDQLKIIQENKEQMETNTNLYRFTRYSQPIGSSIKENPTVEKLLFP